MQVLLIANNKLSALPNDIGGLKNLMELNASCNEISHLPRSLGQLKYLRALDLRKNLLEELPIGKEWTSLSLPNITLFLFSILVFCFRINVPEINIIRHERK